MKQLVPWRWPVGGHPHKLQRSWPTHHTKRRSRDSTQSNGTATRRTNRSPQARRAANIAQCAAERPLCQRLELGPNPCCLPRLSSLPVVTKKWQGRAWRTRAAASVVKSLRARQAGKARQDTSAGAPARQRPSRATKISPAALSARPAAGAAVPRCRLTARAAWRWPPARAGCWSSRPGGPAAGAGGAPCPGATP